MNFYWENLFSASVLAYIFLIRRPITTHGFTAGEFSYRVNKWLGMGLNLKAHKQVAEYIDLRFVYSFRGFKN